MKTSHILVKREEEGSEKLSYCNIGLTRQTTVADAFAVNELRKFEITIKFCPWDEVDEEMELFVKRFRVSPSLIDACHTRRFNFPIDLRSLFANRSCSRTSAQQTHSQQQPGFNMYFLLSIPSRRVFGVILGFVSSLFSGCLHPQGGNGRLARMLASVPLLMHGLPPLCIPSSDKESYMIALNFVREISTS